MGIRKTHYKWHGQNCDNLQYTEFLIREVECITTAAYKLKCTAYLSNMRIVWHLHR